MAFTWSNIIAGDTKILADHANTLRTNANTLITLLTANTGKCSNYSCSSLGTIPDAVTAGTTIVYGSWLDDMKASIDRIDTNKYCAQAFLGQFVSHNPANCSGQLTNHLLSVKTTHCSTHCNGVCSTMHSSKFTAHLGGKYASNCGTHYDSHYSSNNTRYWGSDDSSYKGSHRGDYEGSHRGSHENAVPKVNNTTDTCVAVCGQD